MTVNTIEIYRDAGGEFRWRASGPDGAIIAASQDGFADQGEALREVRKVERLFLSTPEIVLA